MFISVIVPTMRVGGLDILFDSLAAQEFTDFELVLVDGLYERRKGIVRQEALDRFLAVRHVGLRPNPFPNCAFCAYANAGIVASSGEVLLFAVDYTRFAPDTLARHARFHQVDPTKRCGLMGPHVYAPLAVASTFPRYSRQDVDAYERDVNAGTLDRFLFSLRAESNTEYPAGNHHADGGVVVPYDADPKLRMLPGQIGPEYFHAKNESVRREHVLAIRGWDTDLDGAHLYQDSDFADRLTVKAGVRWMLDPKALVEIVNPRHVFPFARRSRPHESNGAIWRDKKAAGYPDLTHELHAVRVVEAPAADYKAPHMELPAAPAAPAAVAPAGQRLRVAMIYGEFSSAIHGPFDLAGLYTRTGLTGSESSFFNLARSLAEAGHEVLAFCDCTEPYQHPAGFEIFPIRSVQALPQIQGVDAVVAWNEPDYLQYAPAGALRVCDQQLNDFGYCRVPHWRDLVDLWVSPSHNHVANVMAHENLTAPISVIPNSVDLGLYAGPAPARNPHRAVYCSSPDRGLHLLLDLWPDVRKLVPDAELHVFYRIKPWLDRARGGTDEVGRSARFIEAVLPRLAGLGVVVRDLVPNATMASELQQAGVLAYPCAPVRYTEGFGCSVLDAAAAGCLPIISDADALPEVHGRSAALVATLDATVWAKAIVQYMLGDVPEDWRAAMQAHADAHAREKVAARWVSVLIGSLTCRSPRSEKSLPAPPPQASASP